VFSFSIGVIAENGFHAGMSLQKALTNWLLIVGVPSVRLSYKFKTLEETKPQTRS
jgi:hypothetical protein